MNNEIELLYKDEYLLAVNKPSGILSAPDRYDPNAIIAQHELSMEYGQLWPVHRLDKDSSGVMLFARDSETHRLLSMAFEEQRIDKTYHAIVSGRPVWTETSCDLSLSPDGDRMHRTIIDGSGKPSRTDFLVLGCHSRMAILEARPRTGRTHQIRVHLTALGYPILCDPLYGDGKAVYLSAFKKKWKGDAYTERPLISRTALHAVSLSFDHPHNGEKIVIEAPYPKDFKAMLRQLEKM